MLDVFVDLQIAMNISESLRVIYLAIALGLLNGSAFSCTCSYDTVNAKGFQGQIFSIRSDQQLPDLQQPLPKAKLTLHKQHKDKEILIAEIIADEKGRFSIETIKPGKYFLRARYPGFTFVFVPIKIKQSMHSLKDIIFIALSPGDTCCQGYAKVQ